MDQEQFSSAVSGVFKALGELCRAIDDNPDLLGALSVEDYMMLTGLVKEYAWYSN